MLNTANIYSQVKWTQGIGEGDKQTSTDKKEEKMFWLRATWWNTGSVGENAML